MASEQLKNALEGKIGRQNALELVGRPASDVTVLDTGNFTAATTVEAALAELYQDTLSAQGFIQIPLDRFRLIASNNIAASGTADGGTISFDTAPKLIRVNAATDKCERILWAASSSIEIATTIAYPPDLDPTGSFTVNLRCKMAGAIDTPTIAVGVWEGIGGTDIGSATAALSNALATKSSAAITPGSGFPQFAAITLIPGAHTTDALELYSVYLLYKKRLLTT